MPHKRKDDCRRTMTVQELIRELQTLSPHLEVLIWDTKAHRFTDTFTVHPSLLDDELLITPSTQAHRITASKKPNLSGP
jgi:hypothetical protein